MNHVARTLTTAGWCVWFSMIVIVTPSIATAQDCGWQYRTNSGPAGRTSPGLAYDSSRGVAVLFGGQTVDNQLHDDMWEWNGSQWTEVDVVGPRPSPRSNHAMTYDSDRGVVVLVGGYTGSYVFSTETWEFDGTTRAWSLRSTDGPGNRASCRLVYDPIRQQSYLFGGERTHQLPLDQTWSWDGQVWRLVTNIGPSRRSHYAMAFDSHRGVTVLYGGAIPGGTMYPETWEFDGQSWTLVSASSPPGGRYDCSMAFDESIGACVLFGGSFVDGTLPTDTWRWDGLQWEVCQQGPSGRVHHQMVYDSLRGVVMLFGGYPNDGRIRFGDTWEIGGARDSDSDGLTDSEELVLGTDPYDPDTDDDGLNDGTEVDMAAGTGCPDPLNPDSDGDTLSDGAEVSLGTDPCNTDTDGDGVDDNIDDRPTEPGVSSGYIEEALNTICAYIDDMPLEIFAAPNDNARKGRRNAMCNKLHAAARAVASDDWQDAYNQLESLLQKLDGAEQPPDWMVPGEAKDCVRDEITLLAFLISLGF